MPHNILYMIHSMINGKALNGAFKLFVLVLLALIVSCQTTPKKDAASSKPEKQQTRKASDLSTQGENELLDAIEDALQDQSISKARRLLRKIQSSDLKRGQIFRYQLAVIQFYILTDQQKQAENAIAASRLDFLKGIQLARQIDFFLLYAQVLEAKGDTRTALRMLILADERLSARAGRENQKQIIRMLETLSVEELLREARLAPDLYMRGWYDFAMLKHLDTSYGRTSAKSLWERRYPRHPGKRYIEFITSRQAEVMQAASIPPSKRSIKVAFILPFGDETLGAIANSIVEGYMDMARKYGIRVDALSLDTTFGLSMKDLYARAVDQESDIVIGPLRKEYVQELYSAIRIASVPIIALNDTGGRYRKKENFYVLSSNFEKSVEFAANTAWDSQCRNVAIMAQNESLLAERGLVEFARRWKQLGGNIIAQEVQPQDQRLTEWVSGILDVDNEELEENKDVFRSYLLKLTRLGVSEEDINILLGRNLEEDPLPNVLPTLDTTFLVSPEELATLSAEYYNSQPPWIANSLELQLDARLALTNSTSDASYTKEALQNVMLDFIIESEGSYSRADIECIFLSMDSNRLSRVRPFISFYLANDIPLFSTFLAYNRGLGAAEYADLEGVTYGEFPGLLDNRKRLEGNKVFTKRFYLTGRDSLLLTQTLSRMTSLTGNESRKSRRRSIDFEYYVLGEAGLLYMENNRVYNIPREVTLLSGRPKRQSKLSAFH